MMPLDWMTKDTARDLFQMQPRQLAIHPSAFDALYGVKVIIPTSQKFTPELRCAYCSTKQNGRTRCDSCGAPQ